MGKMLGMPTRGMYWSMVSVLAHRICRCVCVRARGEMLGMPTRGMYWYMVSVLAHLVCK